MKQSQSNKNDPGISLVICTFNPDEKVFLETICSLEKLALPGNMSIECIIVDNNSTVPVESITFIKTFKKRFSHVEIVQEKRQGLSFARLAGIQIANFSTIVFVDDDNVLDTNYLVAIEHCLNKYPAVAVWGPGNIDVSFLEPIPTWINSKVIKKFQERHSEYVEYGCASAKWMPFYPFGTGMVVRREVLDSYREAVQNKRLSSKGRTGEILTSGEDIQIVWEAIKMGRAAGTSPNLKVRHLIPEKRISLQYVKKLVFGTSSAYIPSLVESFPEMLVPTAESFPSNYRIVMHLIKTTIKHSARLRFQILQVELAEYLGGIVGSAKAINSPQEKWIRRVAEVLNFV